MKYHTFFKIEKTSDLDFIIKKLKDIDLKNILKGLFQRKKYVYYPEINTIINAYELKEVYFLKEEN